MSEHAKGPIAEPVDPRPEGLPEDRSELWYVCSGIVNGQDFGDEVKLTALWLRGHLRLEAKASSQAALVDELVAALKSLVSKIEPIEYAGPAGGSAFYARFEMEAARAVLAKHTRPT